MKLSFALFLFLTSASLTFSHESGHGTPEDPIGNLPKIHNSQGDTFGVEGLIKGNLVTLSLRSQANEVVNPAKSGFKDKAQAEITFRGAAKATKFEMKLAGNFYEGKFKGQAESPQKESPIVKLILNEAKGGKKQTVVIENLEQVEGEYTHKGGKPHTH